MKRWETPADPAPDFQYLIIFFTDYDEEEEDLLGEEQYMNEKVSWFLGLIWMSCQPKLQFILTQFHKSFLGNPFENQKLLFQHVSCYGFAIYRQSSWMCTILALTVCLCYLCTTFVTLLVQICLHASKNCNHRSILFTSHNYEFLRN